MSLKKLKPTQKQFFKTALSKKHTEILYAGTAGTGKTYATALFVLMVCNDYKKSRVGVFRKNLTTARKTVWHTYIKAAEELGVKYTPVKGNEPKITLSSGSTIEFFELDQSKDPDFNKVKGLELSFAHIDEANEVEEKGKNILLTRIGRWNSNGVPAWILMTCNPAQGWVRDNFREPANAGTLDSRKAFIQSDARELPEKYAEILKSLPEAEYQRFVLNNWDYSDDPNQLIKYEHIKRNLHEGDITRATSLGIDVAREGNDQTVFAFSSDTGIEYIETFDQQDTITTAKLVEERLEMYTIGYQDTSVDVIGVGGGVVDYLHDKGLYVNAYNSGLRPTKELETMFFKNLRAESYWDLRINLENDTIKILDNKELIKELLSIKYFVKEKHIQIEAKEQIKKRIGRSPDLADAVVISQYRDSEVIELDDIL